jgi:hypothetical protein
MAEKEKGRGGGIAPEQPAALAVSSIGNAMCHSGLARSVQREYAAIVKTIPQRGSAADESEKNWRTQTMPQPAFGTSEQAAVFSRLAQKQRSRLHTRYVSVTIICIIEIYEWNNTESAVLYLRSIIK